jgi:hypothetical protein
MLNKRCICEQRKHRVLILPLIMASLMFCSAPAPAVRPAELKAELVNVVTEKFPRKSFPTHRTGEVQLTYPDGRIQILPYRSHFSPVVANGKVYILVSEFGELNSIVIYDPAKSWGQSFPLPDDFDPLFSSPSFSPDGTRVAYYCRLGGRWENGFIDETGKTVIPLQSDWFATGKFSEGLAKVVGAYGRKSFIDPAGKMVIPPRFQNAGDFSEGLAWVFVWDEAGFIDRTGRMAIPPQFSEGRNFSEGLAPMRKQGWFLKWGFIDKTGKVVIPGQFEGVMSFSEGLVAVLVKGRWGFSDKTGKMVIPAQFDYAEGFSDGLASVEKEKKWGFIDRTGRAVIPLRYNGAGEFSEGLAAVSIGKKAFWGFIDKTGKVVIPDKFDVVGKFQDGVAFVRLENGEEGLIDKTGKVIAPWPYKDQTPHFSGGLAKVLVEGKYGFIDTTGKMVIPPNLMKPKISPQAWPPSGCVGGRKEASACGCAPCRICT